MFLNTSCRIKKKDYNLINHASYCCCELFVGQNSIKISDRCLFWLCILVNIVKILAGSLVTPPSWRSCVIIRSVILSVWVSVRRITYERVNRRRPNMVDMGKGWLSRSGQFLVLIQIRTWIWTKRFYTFFNTGRCTLNTMVTQHRATMQRPWRSLHSLSALVFTVYL